ncbi:MAG: VOC family protein [Gemmatimonadales bacterium]
MTIGSLRRAPAAITGLAARLRAVAALTAFIALPGPATAQRAPTNQPVGAEAVVSIGLTVSDLDRSVAFFTEVLDFRVVRSAETAGDDLEALNGVFGGRIRTAELALGDERIELTQYLVPEGRPLPADSRSNDRWFQHVAIVVSDMDRAYAALRRHRIRFASTGPQLLPASNPNAGNIRAFYFKDPDGHALEAIWFPPGKGDPRWQRPAGRLFLGIDHTAIVVTSTERSLAFYRDLLGFTVAGQSRNYGIEQARLNNVEGASLLITGLRLPAGPGVEFLEYLTPADGRPYPADARANDLVHWQTTLLTRRGDGVDLLATSGVPLVSRTPVTLADTAFAARRAVVVRDPDGHAVRLIAR